MRYKRLGNAWQYLGGTDAQLRIDAQKLIRQKHLGRRPPGNAGVRVLGATLSEPAVIKDASGAPVPFSAVACSSSLDVDSTPPATKCGA